MNNEKNNNNREKNKWADGAEEVFRNEDEKHS